jgi:putative DNA primase/helicase
MNHSTANITEGAATNPLARYPLTDAGNAEAFCAMYGDLVRFDHARARWLVWDSHRWRPDGDRAVDRMALQTARSRHRAAEDGDLSMDERRALSVHAIRSESRARLDAMLALARSMTPISDPGDGWDARLGLVGAPNGVVDLRTGVLRDGRPDDRVTMSLGTAYDPVADCPRWERFLLEVLGDPHAVAYLKRLAGYSLTGEASLDHLIFLMGVGSNGKTTLLDFLARAAGDYAREISATAFLTSRTPLHSTEVADLDGARLATCEELGDAKLNANRLKQVSGGGRVTARKVRQDTTTFRQTWQLWFTTNGLPRADDNSWAFWRRVVAIDFPRIFKAEDDPTLEEDLAAELPGVLRWMVEGATEFYADGIGETPAAVREKTAEYREDTDPLESVFESGYLVAEPEAFAPTAALYSAYQRWATDRNAPPERQYGETGFAKALSGRFSRKRQLVNGAKVRGFVGVSVGAAVDQ